MKNTIRILTLSVGFPLSCGALLAHRYYTELITSDHIWWLLVISSMTSAVFMAAGEKWRLFGIHVGPIIGMVEQPIWIFGSLGLPLFFAANVFITLIKFTQVISLNVRLLPVRLTFVVQMVIFASLGLGSFLYQYGTSFSGEQIDLLFVSQFCVLGGVGIAHLCFALKIDRVATLMLLAFQIFWYLTTSIAMSGSAEELLSKLYFVVWLISALRAWWPEISRKLGG